MDDKGGSNEAKSKLSGAHDTDDHKQSTSNSVTAFGFTLHACFGHDEEVKSLGSMLGTTIYIYGNISNNSKEWPLSLEDALK